MTKHQRNAARIKVIKELYEQQKYMYDNHIHTVENRIVSFSQPYIRPIVRGKAKAPVEFGAKLDMSLDEKGIRISTIRSSIMLSIITMNLNHMVKVYLRLILGLLFSSQNTEKFECLEPLVSGI